MANNISSIICIYSKFSSHCDRFLKECEEFSDMKYICIDNEKIRTYIKLNNSINLF